MISDRSNVATNFIANARNDIRIRTTTCGVRRYKVTNDSTVLAKAQACNVLHHIRAFKITKNFQIFYFQTIQYILTFLSFFISYYWNYKFIFDIIIIMDQLRKIMKLVKCFFIDKIFCDFLLYVLCFV